MSFRARLTLVAAAAVALAVILASVVVWLLVRNQLYREVDNRLKTRAVELVNAGLHPERGPDGNVYLTMHRVTLFLLLIAAGGIAVAAALGLLVSRAALAPVRRLTTATETVTATGDLSERIDPGGHDELGRLASSFNTMLGALEESTRAQSQLVADASHELRTPLTSLRTNIEVLASERSLPPGERERLLTDVVDQLREMTTLVAELIELARGEREPAQPEEVRLDLVAADAVERTRRNRPGVTFRTDLHESVVHGVPATIERAGANLLDNAAKWGPPGGEGEGVVRAGEGSVRA